MNQPRPVQTDLTWMNPVLIQALNQAGIQVVPSREAVTQQVRDQIQAALTAVASRGLEIPAPALAVRTRAGAADDRNNG